MGVPISRCLLLLVDGLRPDVAEARLPAGELPHLAAMLEGGGRTRAITVFPSTTSVAYLPFLTGCTPGHCNVPSIRWLDRPRTAAGGGGTAKAVRSYCGYQAPMLDDDIAADVRTIFELVPESIGIFTPIARGLTPERDPSRRERQIWGTVAHARSGTSRRMTPSPGTCCARPTGSSRFVFAQFPAVDGYTHQTDPDAEPVYRALGRVDATVGRLRARLLATAVSSSDSLILLVSDHGASAVHTHLDLADWFRAQGVPTLSHPVLWERAPRAAVMVAGNGSAMVYARPGEPRRQRWPIEQLRRPEAFGIRYRPGRRAAAGAGGGIGRGGDRSTGGIWVSEREWRGAARQPGRRDSAYQPLTGDPLRLRAARRGASTREWLEATWDDGVSRTPSIICSTSSAAARIGGPAGRSPARGSTSGGGSRCPSTAGGHGSLMRSHMQTPVWSSEPLPAEPIRTVDLFPAMLDWLGVPVPAGIDGEPVWLPGQRGSGPGRRKRLLTEREQVMRNELGPEYVSSSGSVAQLDRALASGARGRAFESRRAHSGK